MKRFLMFAVAMTAFLFVPVICIFSQDIPAPPDNWTDVIINLKTWFASFAGIVVITTFLAAMFNGIANVQKGWIKQVVAWIIAILILVVADLVNFGYAAEYPLSLAIVHGLAAGLAANGIFDIPFLKFVLDRVEGLFKKKESTV
jgi:hypothetical protein